MVRPKILVVDDENMIRDSILQYLKMRMECEVEGRSGGTEALVALRSEEFHVLLQDLHMPGIDGYTVLREARKLKPDLIMIVITRLDSGADIRMVEDLGALYLAKPFELRTLQKLIERELRKRGGFEFGRLGPSGNSN